MTLLASETFEGGSDGAVVSISNTIFGSKTGSGTALLKNAAALFNVRGMELLLSSNSVFVPYTLPAAKTTIRIRWYVKINPAPSGGTQIPLLELFSGGTRRCQITMTSPAGRINLRSPTTAQDTGDIDWSNQWLRLEYSVTGTTQTLDIFAGANLHGATPSETLTGAVTNGSGFNTVRVGSAISDSLTMFIDEFAIDDANMPARLDDPTPPEEGDFNYVWDGSSLLAADPYFWNGTTLEPLDAYVWDGTQLT